MHSFINMLANDLWSEADIVNRTEALIRSEFSTELETIINRKITGSIMRMYSMTNDEQTQLAAYAALCAQARIVGQQSRDDMLLLTQVMEYEQADPKPEQVSQAVLDLFNLRNPETNPENPYVSDIL